MLRYLRKLLHPQITIIVLKEPDMSDLTDKLDAAVAAAIAKLNAAGDPGQITALQQQVTDLTAKNADLQSQLDAANATIAADEADIGKNADALNAAVNPAPAG